MQPLAAITLMQSFPLHVVNDDRSRLAFANGQYILIERRPTKPPAAIEPVRERFVEDIGIAERVKALGLPIRVALVRGMVSVPDVFVASASSSAAGAASSTMHSARKTWRLALKLLDPIIFCQSGHVALAVAAGA